MSGTHIRYRPTHCYAVSGTHIRYCPTHCDAMSGTDTGKQAGAAAGLEEGGAMREEGSGEEASEWATAGEEGTEASAGTISQVGPRPPAPQQTKEGERKRSPDATKE
eukprot:3838250-Rhodomonas_salina.1